MILAVLPSNYARKLFKFQLFNEARTTDTILDAFINTLRGVLCPLRWESQSWEPNPKIDFPSQCHRAPAGLGECHHALVGLFAASTAHCFKNVAFPPSSILGFWGFGERTIKPIRSGGTHALVPLGTFPEPHCVASLDKRYLLGASTGFSLFDIIPRTVFAAPGRPELPNPHPPGNIPCR